MPFNRDDIDAVVQGVWSTMLFAEVAPVGPAAAGAPAGPLFRGTIAIVGDWSGTLALDLAVAQAHVAACAMLDMKPGETSDDDAREIASELTNIIGGNVKALLPEGARLGLPAVELRPDAEWPPALPGEISRHAFAWDGAVFWLSIAAA